MGSPPVIAVVDDDASVGESLGSLFRSVGFVVRVFASAEEFLNSDHLSNTDCLILDVRMPRMHGLELQHYLADNRPEIPVIFITAHGSDEEVRSQALRDGAVDFLLKPFTEKDLLGAIQRALDSNWRGTKHHGPGKTK